MNEMDGARNLTQKLSQKGRGSGLRSRTRTIRSAALPSQSSGIWDFFDLPLLNSSKAERIPSALVPTSLLVPSSMVTGLSVFSRMVKKGNRLFLPLMFHPFSCKGNG